MDVTDVDHGGDVRIGVDTVDERRRRLELRRIGRRRAVGSVTVDGEGERTVVRLRAARCGYTGDEAEQSESGGGAGSCGQAEGGRTSWHPRTSDVSIAPPWRDRGRPYGAEGGRQPSRKRTRGGRQPNCATPAGPRRRRPRGPSTTAIRGYDR